MRDKFGKWLPDEIIDCHAHCNLPEHVLGFDGKVFNHMMSTFPSFTFKESAATHRAFFPSKTVRALRFANAFKGINHKAANNYLVRCSPASDRIALYGPPDDVDYTVTELNSRKYSAYKSYYLYCIPPATEIYQFFPKPALDEAQRLEIPIILHLPKDITKSGDQLERLLRDFPRLRVTLAHLGLPHIPVPGLDEAYQKFAKYDTVMLDTAMIPSADVVYMAIHAFGPERIMFGTDQPLHMIRSTVYENPDLGQRLITKYPYHWVNRREQEQFAQLVGNPTHTLWQALGAIKEAIERFHHRYQRGMKEQIFFSNARELYKF